MQDKDVSFIHTPVNNLAESIRKMISIQLVFSISSKKKTRKETQFDKIKSKT